MTTPARYSIGELADLAGISRRSVRFYVQRGLLQPPEGVGRGNHYTPEHLERLLRIKALQEVGHSLDVIAEHLHSHPHPKDDATLPGTPTPKNRPSLSEIPIPPTFYLRLPIIEGCELHLDRTKFRPTQAAMRQLQQAIRDILETPSGDSPETDAPSPVKSREEPTDE